MYLALSRFYLLPVLAVLLSACSDDGSSGKTSIKSFILKDMTFSIPVGLDGYVSAGSKSVGWGFDPKRWAQTVGVVGATGAVRPFPFPIVGFSELSRKASEDVLKHISLSKMETASGPAFISTDPIYKFPPVYYFYDNLPGYVECPTSTTSGKAPDMERCYIHIIKDGVEHSFLLTKTQVSLASEVAQIFLATVTAKY